MTLLLTFLGGILTAAIAAIIAGLYNLRTRQLDYVNDYFKVVVNRRVVAYEQVERLILNLKTAVVDPADKTRPYHALFSNNDDPKTAFELMVLVSNQALWLTTQCFRKTQQLNKLFYAIDQAPSVIEFGKKNYVTIANLRAELEDIVAADMIELHNVPKFFKQKERQAGSGFEAFNV